MKFLVDAQLPPGVCAGLAARGHDGVHVFDLLPGQTPDNEIADLAIRLGRILITKDDAFVERHARPGLVVIWLRLGNTNNRVLAQWLTERWDAVEAALAKGESLVEVR